MLQFLFCISKCLEGIDADTEHICAAAYLKTGHFLWFSFVSHHSYSSDSMPQEDLISSGLDKK